MLRLTVFEFIIRSIPEAFVFILASYALSSSKINVKRYIISSSLLAACVYSIRMLPINYGVHTILSIITQILILININKIEIIPAVKSSIITFICLFLIELLNMSILSFVFKGNLEVIMSNAMLKTIYGLPSLICFATIALSYYYHLRKKDKFRDV